MPKVKISEFSSTPANNTDIDSINISEGCAPSGINDAIRELMSQLKDFQVGSAGDPVTVGGVLTVQAGAVGTPAITTAGDTNTGIFFPAADTIAFAEGGVEAMRIDSSGNLGLGVTPTNNTLGKTLQIGQAATWTAESGTNRWWLGSNWYFNSGDKYINNGFATLYSQQNGTHQWYNAPSGTAGNAITFTQAMTLSAAGGLSVGTTDDAGAGNIRVPIGKSYTTFNSDFGIGTPDSDALQIFAGAGNGIRFGNRTSGTFTERARIDSSGNFLVGVTSASYSGATRRFVAEGSFSSAFTSTGGSSNECVLAWNTATSGDNIFVVFKTEGSTGTGRGSISYNRGAGLTAYNTTSDYRAKDIIGPVADSGALIDSVPVYMGKMKGATQERPMFIAHEVPAYAHTGEKDAVDADGNPVYQQMDASSLIPVMWAEIQSLRKRLADAGIA